MNSLSSVRSSFPRRLPSLVRSSSSVSSPLSRLRFLSRTLFASSQARTGTNASNHAAAFTPSRSFSTRNVIPASKVYNSPAEALKAVEFGPNSSIAVGGFGVCGCPESLLEAVQETGAKGLTIYSNDCGIPGYGLGLLLPNHQIGRLFSSYIGENPDAVRQYLKGEMEVILTPQGSLAEKLRAGGAGIPGFYTRTGLGTLVQKGMPILYDPTTGKPSKYSQPKEVKVIGGREYIFEESFVCDYALIKAYKADPFGNCVFHETAWNFNSDCAQSAKRCIVEADEIVDFGVISPSEVQLPGIYVDAVIKTHAEKLVTKMKWRKTKEEMEEERKSGKTKEKDAGEEDAEVRERIVRRAALEFKDGMNVNLGIGMPTLTPNFCPSGVRIMLQSENGLLGMGPYPLKHQIDPDLINAGKEPVTTLPGSSVFASSTSFAMIRGGHMNITMLGAFQVSQFGDIASWIIPGKSVKGMGGAMDLVASGSRVVVLMSHLDKWGKPKIKSDCDLPVTGVHCVNRIITELAVFDIDPRHGLILKEIAPDCTLDKLKSLTDSKFEVDKDLKTIQYSDAVEE